MTRIAPTEAPYQRQKVFRSPRYLKSAKGRPCDACGSVGTTVFCHDRRDLSGGMGMKPDDRLGFFGCADCHQWQEANHETTKVWGVVARKIISGMRDIRNVPPSTLDQILVQRLLMRERYEMWRKNNV